MYAKLSLEEVATLLLGSEPKSTKLFSYLLQLRSFLTHTTMKKINSDKKRLSVQCKDPNCKFKFVATKAKGEDALLPYSSHLEHTCDPAIYVNQKRSSIPSEFLIPFVSEYVNSDPNPTIKGLPFLSLKSIDQFQ